MSTDPNEDDEVPFPLAVKIAGWIWIFVGGLNALVTLLSLVLMRGVDVSRVYFAYFFAFLFAIVGVAGFETIRGLPRDIRPHGIGSIALALTLLPLFIVLGIFLLVLLRPAVGFPGILSGAWIADGMLGI